MAHTKKLSMNFYLMAIVFMSLVAFTSCSGDDPIESEKPVYPTNPDTPSEDDDKSDQGDTQPQYLKTLLNHKVWSWYKSTYDNGFFTFYDTNKIQFVNSGKSMIGSYGVPNLDARGTFTISGSTLTATYSDVSVDVSLTNSQMSTNFPGWSVGSTKTVKYTIKSLDDSGLILTDGSKTWILGPLF